MATAARVVPDSPQLVVGELRRVFRDVSFAEECVESNALMMFGS
jgi:hypothetical protein